jgi:hypothetical protein
MIRPTIGRKVWYTPAISDQHCNKLGNQPMDATVVFVHSDTMVNLAVRDHCGIAHAYPSVPLLQEGQEVPVEGQYAEWMPYQRGQAAKTEELERRSAVGTGG